VKKVLKRAVIIFAVIWLLLFVGFIVMESDKMDFDEILSSCTTLGIVLSLLILAASFGVPIKANTTSTVKTNLLSCQKCGYLGVGGGTCPKCRWSYTTKITSKTTMISCPDCGYLGAGYGHSCPKCGHTRAEKIEIVR